MVKLLTIGLKDKLRLNRMPDRIRLPGGGKVKGSDYTLTFFEETINQVRFTNES